VCILSGADAPLILRPKAIGGQMTSKFELIGECYIHGMMHGEQMEKLVDKEAFVLQ
jgi:hypothetical protein